MQIKTVTCKIEHLDQLSLLFDAYRIFYRKESNVDQAKQFMKERIENKDSKIFVALNEDEKLVGFVQLYPIFSSTQMKRFWLLNDLYVDADFRGNEIGKLLIEASKKLAIDSMSSGLMLETERNNSSGIRLYEKTGFKCDEEHFYFFWET